MDKAEAAMMKNPAKSINRKDICEFMVLMTALAIEMAVLVVFSACAVHASGMTSFNTSIINLINQACKWGGGLAAVFILIKDLIPAFNGDGPLMASAVKFSIAAFLCGMGISGTAGSIARGFLS